MGLRCWRSRASCCWRQPPASCTWRCHCSCSACTPCSLRMRGRRELESAPYAHGSQRLDPSVAQATRRRPRPRRSPLPAVWRTLPAPPLPSRRPRRAAHPGRDRRAEQPAGAVPRVPCSEDVARVSGGAGAAQSSARGRVAPGGAGAARTGGSVTYDAVYPIPPLGMEGAPKVWPRSARTPMSTSASIMYGLQSFGVQRFFSRRGD